MTIPLVSSIFKLLMYADDTTLYCNIDQNVDEDTIYNELANIWEWLITNNLSIYNYENKIYGSSYQSEKCDLSQLSN